MEATAGRRVCGVLDAGPPPRLTTSVRSMILLAMAGRGLRSVAEQRHSAMGAGWFFLVIALFMLVTVIHPVWRAKWRWGRRRPGAPVSAFGRAAWIICFSLGSIMGFAEGLGYVETGSVGPVFFVGLGLVFVAAIYDSWRCKRSGREGASNQITRANHGQQ